MWDAVLISCQLLRLLLNSWLLNLLSVALPFLTRMGRGTAWIISIDPAFFLYLSPNELPRNLTPAGYNSKTRRVATSPRVSFRLVLKIRLLSDHRTVSCLLCRALKTFNCTICTFVFICIYVFFRLSISLESLFVCLNNRVILTLVWNFL